MSDCAGIFYGDDAPFACGKAGSKECEFECPRRIWIGKTKAQLDAELNDILDNIIEFPK